MKLISMRLKLVGIFKLWNIYWVY